jgi:putative nucleotidyltransferase-like protein
MNARPEWELLLCCTRLNPDSATQDRAKVLLQQNPDWDYLLQLALRQRVMPLLYRQLNQNFTDYAPADFMERLRDYFYLNAARNHLFTEELCELLRLFETNGIRAVAYKGPVLAAAVYGDVALRQFSDLDIMIRKEDVMKARALLRLHAYGAEHELTRAQEAALVKIECEQMFFREQGHIYVDLHWEFTPKYFPLKLDTESIWQRLATTSLGKTQALTFSTEDSLLILCVNAGKEFWPRLSGLCDVAAFVCASLNLDWERLTREATRANARRMLFVSLLLAHELLGAPIPAEIVQSLAADSKARFLASVVRQNLFCGEKEGAGVSQFLKPAKALDGLGDRAKFHLRLLLTPTLEDWTFINWPERFRSLYYLTRPFRLAGKYVLHQRRPVLKPEKISSPD